MIRWAAIFLMMMVVDYVWARYTVHVANRNAPMATFFSIWIVVLGALTVVGYTQDPWLILPASLGAGAGTYLTVRYST